MAEIANNAYADKKETQKIKTVSETTITTAEPTSKTVGDTSEEIMAALCGYGYI